MKTLKTIICSIIGMLLILLFTSKEDYFVSEDPLSVQYVGISDMPFPNKLRDEIIFVVATNKKGNTVLIQSNHGDTSKEMRVAILSLKKNDSIHIKMYCQRSLVSNMYHRITELLILSSGVKIKQN